MRHRKKKVTLDRTSSSRQALLANLAESLILYEKVKTTKAKAKAVQPIVERLITVAKKDTLAARRSLLAKLYTKNAVNKLLTVLAPRYRERQGGFTRLTAVGERAGDGATEAVIEFI